MKNLTKVLAIVVILIGIPLVVGLFLPKERLVTETTIIDKMYFFILADITNHFEEAAWRTNVDTLIQQPEIDGQEAWKEFYTNGDSVLFTIQKTAETDYIRIIMDPDGRQRMRTITLADVRGKTAIRFSEEVLVANPFKRVYYLFNDKPTQRVKQYLVDLKEKHKTDPNAEEDNSGW